MFKREDKEKVVKDFNDKFSRAEIAFVADYKGVKVEDMTAFRSSLREAGVELKILRNTLARIAVKGTSYENLTEHIKGPVAVAISYSDVAAAAKVVIAFDKENDAFELKAGSLGDKLLTLDEMKSLAELPSRDELLAKLLGGLKNVPGGLVGVLSAVPRKFVGTLEAIKNAKEAA